MPSRPAVRQRCVRRVPSRKSVDGQVDDDEFTIGLDDLT